MSAAVNATPSQTPVPRAKSRFIFGNLPDYKSDMLNFEKTLARERGDVVSYEMAFRHIHLISHPDDVHKVLVSEADKFIKAPIYRALLSRFLGNGLLTSDGDFWKRQRKLAQPAFHFKRIQTYAETMVNYTDTMLNGWQDGQTYDINRAMMHLTLNIVVKSLFNTEIGGQADRIAHALTEVLEATTDGLNSVFQLMPAWVPIPRNLRNKRGVRQLDMVIHEIIEGRRGSEQDTGDLLSMLMLAEDEDGSRMTDKQLRDEVVTLVLAGHETTANALTWALYLLSQHPDVEAKLHAELETVLDGRTPTMADMKQLEYTSMVVKETMRMYPPIPSFARQATVPVTLGGYDLPKEAIIVISPHVLHADPRWWDAPDQFRPERFSKENEKLQHKYSYLPFGGGPRVCIGNSFAEMEAVLLLARMAQQYTLRLDPPDQTVIPEPTLTLRPLTPLTMKVQRNTRES